MKKRLILSIIAMITVLLLLSACGADEITAPQDTTIPQDTTTSNVIFIETTPAETTPSKKESDIVCEEIIPEETTSIGGPIQVITATDILFCGTIKEIMEAWKPTRFQGYVYNTPAYPVRTMAITSSDWYEDTELQMSRRGWDLEDETPRLFKYGPEFFEDSFLLMVEIPVGDPPYKFEVTASECDADKLHINVTQKSPLQPKEHSDASMDFYVFFVEIPVKYNNQQVEYCFKIPYSFE